MRHNITVCFKDYIQSHDQTIYHNYPVVVEKLHYNEDNTSYCHHKIHYYRAVECGQQRDCCHSNQNCLCPLMIPVWHLALHKMVVDKNQDQNLHRSLICRFGLVTRLQLNQQYGSQGIEISLYSQAVVYQLGLERQLLVVIQVLTQVLGH